MKRGAWLTLLLLICAACDGPRDPYTAMGQAQGAIAATQQAASEAGRATSAAMAAGQFAAQSTAQAQAMIITADAWQATSAAGGAMATALNASAQSTADAAWITSLQAQATATAMPAQATQSMAATATAYQMAATTARTTDGLGVALRVVILVFVGFAGVIALILLWWLSGAARRIVDAKAAEREAIASRGYVMESNGYVYDLSSGRVRVVRHSAGELPSGLPRPEKIETVSPDVEPSDIATFVTDAGRLTGWNVNKFPSAEEMETNYQYSHRTWEKFITQLKMSGWVLTRPGGTFITRSRTIDDLYAWVASMPVLSGAE